MDQESREIHERVTTRCATDHDSESVIAIRANHIADTNANSITSTLSKPVIDQDEAAKREEEERNSSCLIDVKDFMGDNERICRICHLSEKEIAQSSVELVVLGCGCKGELGVAHLQCAETWFRLKGNRSCEICGEAAKNITGGRDNGFMEEWSERNAADSGNSTSDGSRTCLRRQPLCNLLMACLILAFVLPWFLNMF